MTEHEENLRDLASMFAMNALIQKHTVTQLNDEETVQRIADISIAFGDAIIQAKQPKNGIVAVKRRKKDD